MASITASIRPRNLDHDLLGKPLEYSPDPLDQLVRGVAWSFVGVPLSCAPHKTIHLVEVRGVWRGNGGEGGTFNFNTYFKPYVSIV